MGLIPQTFIDELIARTDIVEVIGTRVQLKKAGREFRACCPFHNEKTPSFWVSPDKQFYHCFGCGAHGTVLRFLMEHDRMAFPEAVEELATRLSLEVPREGAGEASSSARRTDEPLYELMGRVARFYSETLQQDERARQYARLRGLDAGIAEQFGIGFAPNSWNAVLTRFGALESDRRQLAELGLVIERERGAPGEAERYYDRFRDRLMFPIRDARGRVIAFGGRIIDQGEPKYLNSPETVLFHKGRELYGLYETRRSRAALKRLVVVEGYMDAVRLHQAGLTYAVATLGTATTPEHFKRMFRLVNDVVFAFDGDRAGRAAAWRALQHALPEAREGREIRFLFLPEGHDPDTLVAEEGAEGFERRLQADTLPLSEYLIRELSSQVELTSADGLARFAELARPLFAKVAEGVFRDLLLVRLARVIGLGPERLQALWGASTASPVTPAGSAPSASAAAAPVRRAPTGPRTSAGRGSVVRQAILSLLWFPEIATHLSDADRAGLDGSDEPGIELLRELLDNLRVSPAQVSAQVLERWADKPDGEHLAKLLQREEIVGTATAAANELRAAVLKLADGASVRRLRELEAHSRVRRLTTEELQEFQKLMMRKAPSGTS